MKQICISNLPSYYLSYVVYNGIGKVQSNDINIFFGDINHSLLFCALMEANDAVACGIFSKAAGLFHLKSLAFSFSVVDEYRQLL